MTPLARKKALLLAEGALLRAEAVHEVHQVKVGLSIIARLLSTGATILGLTRRRPRPLR
ncbi:hypothetical protein [Oceanidesulfovibrio marinus]|nr:hypothetical protein [Oceanidesulfovibrio marinus]